MWRDVKKIIQKHQNFLLTTHVSPDGDGIGAACALTELLLMQGKQVRFVCDSHIPEKFAFLNYRGVHEVYDPVKGYEDVEVMMVLDTHRRDRIGRLESFIDRPGVVTVCIDHHKPQEAFTSHFVIHEHACSVGAMVYTLFKESGFDLNFEAATGIYTSVICDTGRFSYSSTDRKAHKIAEECMRKGVDPDEMFSRLFQHVPIFQVKMFAKALQNMETHLDDRVVIQEIRREDCQDMSENGCDLESADLEYIHEFNKLIEDVECVILLRELENEEVRISLRSKSDLDIVQIVKTMGGGGHSKAAGASWKGSLEEVKEKVLGLLEEALG